MRVSEFVEKLKTLNQNLEVYVVDRGDAIFLGSEMVKEDDLTMYDDADDEAGTDILACCLIIE